METLIIDWLHLIVRWLHIITGIAWIGASFYFVYLNNHLRPPEEPKKANKGVDTELWAIHGGGFYRVERYGVAPDKLPKKLHWFMWEAYTTWISGFFLLMLVYWLGADVYMIDPSIAKISATTAVLIGLGTLVGGWLFYDLVHKSPIGKNNGIFFGILFLFTFGVAYLLSMYLSGRAAYIHVGAMLGTIMAANVFFVIIPNQKELVKSMEEGREPDKETANMAKMRSLHNNYITLPVLFIMISNHYPFTFGHTYNWAVLAALSVLGAAVRHWFNLRGRGEKNVYIWPAAAAGMIALALVSAPRSGTGGEKVPFAKAQEIIKQHCVSCHSATPTDDVFKVAPQGTRYDTPEEIRAKAEQIKKRAVDTITMPLANKTGMTKEEREILGRWIDQGANLD